MGREREMSTRRKAAEPTVDVELSRKAYRLGGTIVGTIRVILPDDRDRPRDTVNSIQLVCAGRCRLDPRWHNVPEYQKVYATHPSLSDLSYDSNSVCFWATEPIELLNVQERPWGRWDDIRPKPIQLSGYTLSQKFCTFPDEPRILEDEHLAFTFRVDLPDDLPHSVSATSCRLYYSVLFRLILPNKPRDPMWIQTPFTVLSVSADAVVERPATKSTSGAGRVQVGQTAHVMAHSVGLPCHVTAPELFRLSGRLTVNQRGAGIYRHMRRHDAKHIQTMRVADSTGRAVGVLTTIGVSVLNPGSRCMLKLYFPNLQDDASRAPCYQFCACLQGEEIAIHRDGTRKRARSFLFDTVQETIDPDCTECACLNLLLPLDAPCSLQSDLVEINIRCLVDITVDSVDGKGYQNLRLEIPCTIVHALSAFEENEEDGSEFNLIAMEKLLKQDSEFTVKEDINHPHSFETSDIGKDLKLLSLAMAKKCNLIPDPPVLAKED